MKKKYEIILNRIKKYIIENGPVSSAQIHDWYIDNYGTKQAPATTSIASILRMYGSRIGIVGEKQHKRSLYTWKGK